ncbi:RluA family pseudouridine synthase [Desmospora profundinema]|uniref:Pseudouridine synthase n=1 Tax=Desmospora profundinema TaxID=1571184 RepID=A0ABU1IPM8_9BACL|nr:RluA family pseudouridine synthase [Desmospora profundinema]MDR6225899.1 23S rRNA pseudouridine1911/1915/1917 synthase [Desmospora profundinema]
MDEMNRDVFLHLVKKEEAGKLLRQVLQNRFRFSRRMLRRLRESQGVTVNGRVMFFTSRVEEGDQIRITLPADPEPTLAPQPVPLRIVFEDEDLIVLDKEPGQVVHPTKDYRDNTLANGLVYHWLQRGEQRLARPVTRLDKDTSGLIVFAKHAYAHAFLAKEMDKRCYEREYLAVVRGEWPEGEGVMDEPIGRSPDEPHKRMVRVDGARAFTRFQVERRFKGATLLRLKLETGRTHQIRVHLSHRGYPIFGDSLYGMEETGEESIRRQALHAVRLTVVHPRDRRPCIWESPIPEDMKHLINRFLFI